MVGGEGLRNVRDLPDVDLRFGGLDVQILEALFGAIAGDEVALFAKDSVLAPSQAATPAPWLRDSTARAKLCSARTQKLSIGGTPLSAAGIRNRFPCEPDANR